MRITGGTEPLAPARPRRTTRAGLLAAAAAVLALVLGTAAPASATGPEFPATLGPWTLQATSTQNTGAAGEGYASVAATGGWVWAGLTATKFYNSAGTQTARILPPAPYTHIGDPDAYGYLTYIPLQRNDGGRTQGFQIRNGLTGAVDLAEWSLPYGYQINNSWVAISPDGKWMLNGGWGDQTYFMGFVRPTAGGPITIKFRVTLDRTLRNVQGCDFVTNMRLVCADDLEGAGNKSIWAVDFNHYLDGVNRSAHVTRLGDAPGDQTDPACVEGETEGLDYNTATKVMRFTFIDGCSKNKTGLAVADYK